MKKFCPGCKETKHTFEFYKHAGHKDGLKSNCKECDKSRVKNNYYKNIVDILNYKKIFYRSNKQAVKEKQCRYQKENLDKFAAYSMKRKAAKLKASPSWLSKEHEDQIQEIYSIAKDLQWLSEEKLEVDHIEPLQGKNISGLHVPWNLQILPKSMNCSKGNRA